MNESAVFDVDGTLCFDGRTVSTDILEALRALRSVRPLIFASARPIRDLYPVLPEDLRKEALIGGNGAFVQRRGGGIDVVGFAPSERDLVDALIEATGCAYLIDGEWNYSYTGEADHRIYRQLDAGALASTVSRAELGTYSKVVLFTEDEAVRERLRSAGLTVTHHPAEGLIDIAPSGISKHAALVKLQLCGDGYTAFGNDANDVDLLRHADASFCVGQHELLSFADHHLEPDDVAPAILGLARG